MGKTQNQALNALVCFFRHGLGEEPGEIGEYLRAKVSRRLPTAVSGGEAVRVMEVLRFREEGVALRFLEINGAWEDHVRYAITAEEWTERRDELGDAWLAAAT